MQLPDLFTVLASLPTPIAIVIIAYLSARALVTLAHDVLRLIAPWVQNTMGRPDQILTIVTHNSETLSELKSSVRALQEWQGLHVQEGHLPMSDSAPVVAQELELVMETAVKLYLFIHQLPVDQDQKRAILMRVIDKIDAILEVETLTVAKPKPVIPT